MMSVMVRASSARRAGVACDSRSSSILAARHSSQNASPARPLPTIAVFGRWSGQISRTIHSSNTYSDCSDCIQLLQSTKVIRQLADLHQRTLGKQLFGEARPTGIAKY
jgi:hypothetical protein